MNIYSYSYVCTYAYALQNQTVLKNEELANHKANRQQLLAIQNTVVTIINQYV